MAYTNPKNTSSSSTTWTPKVDRMRRTPAGRATSPQAPSRWYKVGRRDPKRPLDIKITYRGGSEAWWLVEARGRHGVFPGHMALHDVMREINGQWERS